MISIIVPIYNAEKHLMRCVESILAQTFPDYELLLINDGSRDGSREICDEYAAKDKRIRVFHKENGGVSSARNLGLDNAKGEWVTFCDSDDYVKEDWLRHYIDNKEWDIIVSDVKIIGPDYEDIISKKYVIEGDGRDIMVALKYDGGSIGYPWNKLFRNSIIKNNSLRFREDIKLREDEVFVLEYLKYVKRGKILDRGGYIYVLPDYWNKYKDIDVFDTIIYLYNTAKEISRGKNNSALDNYQIELTMHLVSTIFAGNYSHIKSYLFTMGFNMFRWIIIKAVLNKCMTFLRKKNIK